MDVLKIATLSFAVALMIGPGYALAQQQQEDKDHLAVFEIGSAGEWGLGGNKPSFGPSVAVEVTPIENWLEIEAGLTPLMSKGGTEWETDLVFKKPFQLSKNVEFMVGVGPQWSSTNSFGATAVLDFMFWTSRNYGWFVEPSYSHGFSHGHENNVAVNVGLLIGLPPH